MKKFILISFIFYVLTSGLFIGLYAQNPIIRNQFTADPTARVFNGKVYLFPSHDIPAPERFPRKDWFCMEDYHVFSSSNLTEWTDHGVIVSQYNVNWVDTNSFSMWAPDCVERNGKYYFYFPANVNAKYGKGFGIGVAVADKPEGPYVPQPEPIKGVRGIDPCVLIDEDGQAYLYYSLNRIFVAKLKENMLELDSEPVVIANLPAKGLIEGPFVFERNGIYYLTYPHVENKTERLEYAIADSPMGPFKVAGVIMDESPTGCWTNHHSIVEYNGQWYLFYHHNDYSPKFDKNRSARIDSLFFNADGTIRKVVPTLRGVGLTSARDRIEIDRYSQISDKGVSLAFIDTLNTFKGWKIRLGMQNAWVKYNSVDFGNKKLKSVNVRVFSLSGSVLQIKVDSADGLLLGEVKIPSGVEWTTVRSRIKNSPKGVHHLVVILKGDNPVEVDWVQFGD
ncbi:MAG TPA: family 43 glycosylhydrolase [Bacteroidales bacterium]|nr:family 43 glycosylhydrolase [Bacteroidales bacterium]HOK75978.1 family 43 glycosylhydrolase [Bacteroidales bacterium]HOM41305.1 family 43 glycosylhydrolase [Bacteroidales bacterium]HPP92082.1 family 43 glycosylhydrolase [Bacteroidales bacterium]HQK70468.1 family 43 glycosylhydrolase [Bacteroidales bacterium]